MSTVENASAKRHHELRPWGSFIILAHAPDRTWWEKSILVRAGKALSYQSHREREETWVVTYGQMQVVLNENEVILNEGDAIHIPIGAKHRAIALDSDCLFFERAEGVCDETDIIRYDDRYGRT